MPETMTAVHTRLACGECGWILMHLDAVADAGGRLVCCANPDCKHYTLPYKLPTIELEPVRIDVRKTVLADTETG